MCGHEMIAEILRSHYRTTHLQNYSESDDEIRFQLPAPIADPQTAAFRSQATVLNELAISHRLSLLAGRAKYELPDDFAFAIKSVASVVHSSDLIRGYDLSLRFEILSKRRDTITALKTTLTTKHGCEARTTTTSFNVLPPALANFVRRGRQFLDFAVVKMSRDNFELSTAGNNHFRYYPSEGDRLSDGKRVDHVPALTLIDIALSLHESFVCSNISAEFLNYTDPRIAFDIHKKDRNAVEFLQNGQVVAMVDLAPNNPVPN